MAFNLGDVLKNVPNSGTAGREQITYLPLDNLDSDAENFYALQELDALADNISTIGLQQPIRVRTGKELGRYTIVSGHRRTAAIRLLATDAPEKWKEVPCIIEADTVSPALQQLRLIFANANTRQRTSAEIAEEAERVTKLLYELQEEGYSFPGRMRDHVAEAVGVSKSKLSRLKVIRSGLIPAFMRLWEANKLPESVAYTLAGTVPVRQQLIYDAKTKQFGDDCIVLSQNEVANILNEMDAAYKLCERLKCFRAKSAGCDHKEMRLRKATRVGMYGRLSCRGCCRECPQLPYCTDSCEYAGDIKKEKRSKITAESDAKKAAEKEAQKAKIRTDKEALSKAWARVGKLRAEKKILPADFVNASLSYAYPDITQRLPDMEAEKVKGNDRMPGGIWPDEARHLIAAADILGCSVDYLLGRDLPEQQPTVTTCWNTGEPKAAKNYAVLYTWDHEHNLKLEEMYWNGHGWIVYRVPIQDEMHVQYWAEMPNGCSCKTGLSDSGLCGAAAYCDKNVDCCLNCDEDCSLRCGWIEENGNGS